MKKEMILVTGGTGYIGSHTVVELQNAGYPVVYFLKPFTHRQMQQCMDEKILNVSILEGLDRLCEGYFKDYGSEIYLNVRVK